MKFIRIKDTLFNPDLIRKVEIVSMLISVSGSATPDASSYELRFHSTTGEWDTISCENEAEAEMLFSEFQRYAESEPYGLKMSTT